jgi:hypothetical protein
MDGKQARGGEQANAFGVRGVRRPQSGKCLTQRNDMPHAEERGWGMHFGIDVD